MQIAVMTQNIMVMFGALQGRNNIKESVDERSKGVFTDIFDKKKRIDCNKINPLFKGVLDTRGIQLKTTQPQEINFF